jgi:nucleoid-associated protein YgaU
MFDLPLTSNSCSVTMTTMTRTYVRRRLVVVAALAFIMAVAGSAGHAAFGSSGREDGTGAHGAGTHLYVAREGDTLWSIAEASAPGRDPRPLVDVIADVNGIDDGFIVPGQSLEIPDA